MSIKKKKYKKSALYYISLLVFLFLITLILSSLNIPTQITSHAAGFVTQSAKDSLQLYWFLVPTSTPVPSSNPTGTQPGQPTPTIFTPNPTAKPTPKLTPKPTLKPKPKPTPTPKPKPKYHWPFPKKSPSQFNRVDQGWDLQYNKSTPVLAVASGRVNLNHSSDPCGFGNYYPLETLDKPITVNGRRYTEIYYGHVHFKAGILGKHVNAGDQLAYTYPPTSCAGAWPPNWLEIGFWRVGPVGQGSFPTQAGTDMKKWLNSI